MSTRVAPFLPFFFALVAACAEPESEPSESELNESETTHSAALGVRKCANGPVVEGIDVSHYQSDGSRGRIDWQAVKDSGKAFAITAIGDGTGAHARDPYFEYNWGEIKRVGLIRGAYQFLRPGQDIVAQANIAVQAVGRLGAGDLPVTADIEVDWHDPADFNRKLHQWVDLVAAGTGKPPIIYTNSRYWPNVGTSDFAAHPLWHAEYTTSVCPNTVPSEWSTWTFWQYRASAYPGIPAGSCPGVVGDVDLNYFNGSYEELVRFAGLASAVNVTDPRVFNWAFYPSIHPDVASAFEGDFWGMVAHWRDFGVPEGRIGGYGFSSRFYLNSYSDLSQAFGNDYRAAIGHFLEHGIGEGRIGSPVFDPAFYLGQYEDLRNAFGGSNYGAAMTHWVEHGIAEGRPASPAFHPEYYLQAHPDLADAFGSSASLAMDHYFVHGLAEGRSSSPAFDPRFYLERYEDLTQHLGAGNHESAVIHWLHTGIRECRQSSMAFDPRYYLDTHPDLKAAFGDDCVAARDHFLSTLRTEGRSASPVFDARFYLERHADLKQAFGDNYLLALTHWVAHGIAEGRQASPSFDPTYYLQSHRDLADAFGSNYAQAVRHFLQHGRSEGRRAVP